MRLLKKIISVNENHKKLWFLYELIMIIYDIILSIKEGIKLKFRKKIRKAYKESDKKSFTVYIFLRLLVILILPYTNSFLVTSPPENLTNPPVQL